MNAVQVTDRLSKAIQAVESWRAAQEQYPNESRAAEAMFVACYPERTTLITSLGLAASRLPVAPPQEK